MYDLIRLAGHSLEIADIASQQTGNLFRRIPFSLELPEGLYIAWPKRIRSTFKQHGGLRIVGMYADLLVNPVGTRAVSQPFY